jgi:hypothetical protein
MNIFKNIFKRQKHKFTYFKVLNFNKLVGQVDLDKYDSLMEYDEENNHEMENEYFENVYFKSTDKHNLIAYQIFVTQHKDFCYSEFFNDAKSLQSYYLNKYQTPFFYDLLSEQRKESFDIYEIERFINFDDFQKFILPNFKYDFFKPINLEDLDKNQYYIFYNWRFFMDVNGYDEKNCLDGNFNSLIGYLHGLPFGTKSNYTIKYEAEFTALNVILENSCATVDTRLKGLSFKSNIIPSALFIQESYNDEYYLSGKIRDLNRLGDSIRLFNNTDFMTEFEKLMKEFEKYTMLPFEIYKNN